MLPIRRDHCISSTVVLVTPSALDFAHTPGQKVPDATGAEEQHFGQVLRPEESYVQVPAVAGHMEKRLKLLEVVKQTAEGWDSRVGLCFAGVQRKNLFCSSLSNRPRQEPRAAAGHPSPHLPQLFGRGEPISAAFKSKRGQRTWPAA